MRLLAVMALAAVLAPWGACRPAPEPGAPPSPGASTGDTATVAAPVTGAAADTARWQLAYVEFAGELGSTDVEWLRSEGFQVVSTQPQTRSAMVRVPPRYARDPMRANPRIVRFDVQMR